MLLKPNDKILWCIAENPNGEFPVASGWVSARQFTATRKSIREAADKGRFLLGPHVGPLPARARVTKGSGRAKAVRPLPDPARHPISGPGRVSHFRTVGTPAAQPGAFWPVPKSKFSAASAGINRRPAIRIDSIVPSAMREYTKLLETPKAEQNAFKL